MLNKNIIQKVVKYELKWKLIQLPKFIFYTVLGLLCFYLLGSDDKPDSLLGFAAFVILFCGSMSSIFSTRQYSRGFSYSYIMTSVKQLDSFLIGFQIAGLILLLPLLLVSYCFFVFQYSASLSLIFVFGEILLLLLFRFFSIFMFLKSHRLRDYHSVRLVNVTYQIACSSLKFLLLVACFVIFAYVGYVIYSLNLIWSLVYAVAVLLSSNYYTFRYLKKVWRDEKLSQYDIKREVKHLAIPLCVACLIMQFLIV